MVDRGERLGLVGQGDLEDAGALAEDREGLRLAEDVGERDALVLGIAGCGRDDGPRRVGDVDAAAVAGRAGQGVRRGC